MNHSLDATAALRGAGREGSPEAPPSEMAVVHEVPRQVRLGMPQLDAAGLSENWLFRHAGALQWEAIADRLGVRPAALRGESGARLYPTVVAVRARYAAPLSAFEEDDRLDFAAEVVPCGRACAHGRITGGTERGGRLTMEVLTTFATREPEGLRTTHLAAPLADRWIAPDGPEPTISRLARAARRGLPLDDAFSGTALAAAGPALGALTCEPSPWGDYNGAGLLYFASYVTLADTAARQILRGLGESALGCDLALATSPVRRDVYYYDNLPLGQALTATLRLCERDGSGVTTHVRLERAVDGRPMADVIARRALLDRGRRKAAP